MQAQLITYQLMDISQAEYLKRMVEPDAPILAKVPGLISKTWLTDEAKNTFGGFYLWESKAAMETFMQSDLVKAVVSRPFVKNVSSVDFEVNQKPSMISRAQGVPLPFARLRGGLDASHGVHPHVKTHHRCRRAEPPARPTMTLPAASARADL